MQTTYSIHSARNHDIIATANPGDLQEVVQRVARGGHTEDRSTARYYVHNGLGVAGAFLTRSGVAHDVLRDDYRQFDATARALRADANLPND